MEIPFRVRQPEGQRVNVVLHYRVQGGNWRSPTPAPQSDQLTNLAAPPGGADYRFVWDAFGDLGQMTTSVEFKMIPYVGALQGAENISRPYRLTLVPDQTLPAADPVPDLSH